MANKFEMNTFDGTSICFEYNSIIICNKNTKEALLEGYIEIEAPTPYIIITNNKLPDNQVDVLEDASIGDCLNYLKSTPAFGGILV